MKHVAFFLAIPILSGCIVVAAAVLAGVVVAGTYTYINGEGTQDYEVTVQQAYDGVLKMCEHYKLNVTDKRIDNWNGYVAAKMADNSDVKIRMEKLADKKTRVGIRIGTIGDEAKTKDMHSTLAKVLGETNKQ
jgi:hypothetical protein